MAGNQISQVPDLCTTCPSHAAQTAVFQTQEILETILENLSFSDLATCQAVSKDFSFSIQNSSLLKWRVSRESVRTETLRYLPTSGGAFGFVIGREITERKLCPLLSFEYEGYRWRASPAFGYVIDREITERTLSPSLPFNYESYKWRAPPECLPDVAAKFSIEEYISDQASWENVYLTNPPVAEAWIGITWRVESDEYEGSYSEAKRIVSEDGAGLTIGKLYKGLMKERRYTAMCGVVRKDFSRGRGAYMSAREKTVAESLARMEELSGLKAEVVKGRCSVSFPKMMGVWKR
jgi:hypothetical protein